MKAKTRFKISNILFISGCLFWFIETIFFLIRDGWHWIPSSQEELLCDKVSYEIMCYGAVFFISLLINVVELFVKLSEFDHVDINQ